MPCRGTRPESLQHAVDLNERPPVSVRLRAVVAGVPPIRVEGDRVDDLLRVRIDLDRDAHAAEHRQKPVVKVRDAQTGEGEARALAGARPDFETMGHEVEVDLEQFCTGRDPRRSDPARVDVERDMPAVVEPRGQG